jgi:enoyl-CoA hydratase/carnithine racemase
MNAFSVAMLLEFRTAVERLEFDPEVRAVILTGTGDRAFSAGADLKERAGMTEPEVRRFVSTIRTTFTMVENLPVPVIAAVNGHALAGGTELALASDLRLVSENATMGLTAFREKRKPIYKGL